MTISMYRASVPVFSAMLKALDHVLAKAERHAAETGADPDELFSARLAADMLPLKSQVQIACDHAKGASCRLAGRDIPSFPDNEVNFTDLHARIAKTRDLLKTFAEADIDGSEEREIVIALRQGDLRFTGMQYLLHYATPNFYFHVTTAYDILRSRGVPLGKADFFGRG
ncbi:MAG: DUF1993 domain-containing protein [Rhizobiaceae bacterium]|nr:MAG: DUF1993 domain-containing protein [Rhizobiaceae bacterium]CAG1005186.1 hypothetical protein RHIZO_03152 [Rhizobiaceae bacterium]